MESRGVGGAMGSPASLLLLTGGARDSRQRRQGCATHRVGTHRPGDVLELLLADVFKGEVETARGILLHTSRDADAARLGQLLEARRDIKAVAEDVAILDDDVALMNADAELEAVVCRRAALTGASAVCSSLAQRTASTTLANSTSRPSPVVLTMRP